MVDVVDVAIRQVVTVLEENALHQQRYISSSYTKIFGQKLFRTREFPRSGSKTKDGKEERREKKTESW